MRVRVLVYNVWGFRRGVDAAVAAVGEHAPDLALVNECGSGPRLARFSRDLGMLTASPSLWPLVRTVRNAVLVRPPWRVVASGLHRFARSKPFYPRGVMVAHVGRAGFRIAALAVHLGLAPVERRRHGEELTDLTLSLPGPFLVGGDLNEGPDARTASWIAERMWDAWAMAGTGPGATFPSHEPSARIDYLFVSEHFRVDRAVVLEASQGSDHLPLLVDLELREPSPPAR